MKFVVFSIEYALMILIWHHCNGDPPRRPLRVDIGTLNILKPVVAGALPYTAPAIDMAMEDIAVLYDGVLNVSQTYLFNPKFTSCIPNMADNSERMASEFYYSRVDDADVVAFVAPGCGDVEIIERLAKSWNILQVSSAASAGHGHSRIKSPTWITVAPGGGQIYLLAMEAILTRFIWTSIYIVSDLSSNPLFGATASDISGYFKKNRRFQQTFRPIHSANNTEYDTENLLADFRHSSRVMIFSGHSNALRSFLIKAYLLNMTNGEYVYFGIQQFHHAATVGLFNWQNSDQYDDMAKSAYRSLLVLGCVYSDINTTDSVAQETVKEWTRRSLERYNFTVSEESPYVRSTYNAMMMVATVLNETFMEYPLFDFKNGFQLTERFLNRTFTSKVGSMFVSPFGDVVFNLTVRAWNPITGKSDVVFLYDGFESRLVERKEIYWPNGHGPPINVPVCGYLGDAPACRPERASIYGDIFGACAALFIFSLGAGLYFRHRDSVDDDWWYLRSADIAIRAHGSQIHLLSKGSAEKETHAVTVKQVRVDVFTGEATLFGTSIWLKKIISVPTSQLGLTAPAVKQIQLSVAGQKCLNEIKRCAHSNINRFVGLTARIDTTSSQQHIYAISDLCSRGSLQDLLKGRAIDWEISCSLITDLLEGLSFLHSSELKFHGNLTSHKCLVDKFFNLRIGEAGLMHLRKLITLPTMSSEKVSQIRSDKIIWVSPEVGNDGCPPSQSTDIYSAAIILYQLVTGFLPYDLATVNLVMAGAFPTLSEFPHPALDLTHHFSAKLMILHDCWKGICPPTIDHLKTAIFEAIGKNSDDEHVHKTVAEKIIDRFDKYSKELEAQLQERTNEFFAEKQKCDRLLREILPSEIISDLQKGVAVLPEEFDSVSVLFSSMVGFAKAVNLLSPLAVSHLLSNVFDLLDEAIEEYRVYKVETIADSYMIAAGLPSRIGLKHVKEICGVAQYMMMVTSLSDNLIKNNLVLKIGIHSGSCVAGICGRSKPRYCLFGDTVNVASRMCSGSEARQIHISASTADLIKKHFPYFILRPRGYITVKGKGEMFTFWLVQQPEVQIIVSLPTEISLPALNSH